MKCPEVFRNVLVRALVPAVLLAVGCDSSASSSKSASGDKAKESGGKAHHCDLIKPISTCFQWEVDAEAAKGKKEFCEGTKGTFSEGACPAEGDLGTCVLTGDKDIHYYTTEARFDATKASEECTKMRAGTWTAK